MNITASPGWYGLQFTHCTPTQIQRVLKSICNLDRSDDDLSNVTAPPLTVCMSAVLAFVKWATDPKETWGLSQNVINLNSPTQRQKPNTANIQWTMTHLDESSPRLGLVYYELRGPQKTSSLHGIYLNYFCHTNILICSRILYRNNSKFPEKQMPASDW